MARGYPGRVRAQDQRAVGLDPAARSSSSRRSSTGAARCGCSTSTCSSSRRSGSRSRSSTTPRSGSRSRSRIRCSSTCSAARCGSALRRDRPRPALRLARPRAGRSRSRVVFLIGFRIALNVMSSNVIDVGYAGRHRRRPDRRRHAALRHLPEGQRARRHVRPGQLRRLRPVRAGLAVERHAGTTCPPRTGRRSCSTSLCLLLLFLVGRRVRGPDLGVTLAYAWAAYPFTLYAMNCNVNDALVGRARPVRAARGGRAVAPRGVRRACGHGEVRPAGARAALHHADAPARCASPSAWGSSLALSFVFVLVYGDPRTFFDRTLGFQASRGSPFSIWGLRGWTTAQTIVQIAGVLLAVAVAFVPAAARPHRAGRADGRRADRPPARHHPLVLPLHRLVLRAADGRAAAASTARAPGRWSPRATASTPG